MSAGVIYQKEYGRSGNWKTSRGGGCDDDDEACWRVGIIQRFHAKRRRRKKK